VASRCRRKGGGQIFASGKKNSCRRKRFFQETKLAAKNLPFGKKIKSKIENFQLIVENLQLFAKFYFQLAA